MKKSEIYFKAQGAIVNSSISTFDKLEILRELIAQEDLALFIEGQEEKENAE